MFNPSRGEVRQFFRTVYRKHRERQPLSPIESMALEIVLEHPEYHGALGDAERQLERDYPPEAGEANPFLHLSLHLAVAEQLSIDQPPGLRQGLARLQTQIGDRHGALHGIIECLGETLWRAQRDNSPPDTAYYLECLERRGCR